MTFHQLIIKIAKILEELNIQYAVTGGYAVSVLGRPRATFDIDIVIELFELKIPSLTKALNELSQLSELDEDMADDACKREGEFNYIHVESGIKVDFWVTKKNPVSQLEIKRRIKKRIDGQEVFFVSPEDLVLSKLRWYQQTQSTRQLEDIESVVKIQKKLDWEYIRKWAEEQRTLEILDKLLGKIKE